MAIVDVTIPQLSESVAEATMLGWRKKPGEAVLQDETLFEVETDKVVFEVPSPSAGVLQEVLFHDGDIVVAGQVVAKIDTEGKAAPTAESAPAATVAAPAPAPVAAPAPPPPVAVPPPPAPIKAPAPVPVVPAATYHPAAGVPPQAMPAAAKLLEEQGLSGAGIPGTGRGGRITKGDVLAVVQGVTRQVPTTSPLTSVIPPQKAGKAVLQEVDADLDTSLLDNRPEERVPMTRLRARIAERLLQSQSSNAILTTFNEVNMQAVIDLRNRYKDKFEKEHGVKLGFMSFFVKAAVYALKKYPLLNASVDGNDIVYHGYFDIGMAVGSPRGLVVPVLRNVDQMSFPDIEKQIAEYGKKAKDGKLTLEELTGGTFSISNGGVFGSMLSTPIINPPQSAILGIHATKDRPVAENGQVVIRPMNYLAMSYDHRIIDGREAVLGLVAIKDAIEDPSRLLFDL